METKWWVVFILGQTEWAWNKTLEGWAWLFCKTCRSLRGILFLSTQRTILRSSNPTLWGRSNTSFRPEVMIKVAWDRYLWPATRLRITNLEPKFIGKATNWWSRRDSGIPTIRSSQGLVPSGLVLHLQKRLLVIMLRKTSPCIWIRWTISTRTATQHHQTSIKASVCSRLKGWTTTTSLTLSPLTISKSSNPKTSQLQSNPRVDLETNFLRTTWGSSVTLKWLLILSQIKPTLQSALAVFTSHKLSFTNCNRIFRWNSLVSSCRNSNKLSALELIEASAISTSSTLTKLKSKMVVISMTMESTLT